MWTPAGAGRRPVMLWYHGGAFSYGSSNGDRLMGANLARRSNDVVVVTVNQRLNVFGHLHLGDLGGPEFAQSANAGTLDMVAALEWVRDNIERFGGDPGNVTIFGQSGGGAKVSTLLAMPAARGLFHKANRDERLGDPPGRARARQPARRGGAARGRHSAQRARPAADPADGTAARGDRAGREIDRTGRAAAVRPLRVRPMVDGMVVPNQPFDPAAPTVSDHVPVLVGGVKDEMAIYLAPDDAVWNRTLSEAELATRVAKVAGDQTERVLGIYRRLYPTMSPADRLIAITTDSNFRIRTLGPGRAAGGARQGAGLSLFVRVGDAAVRRQAEIVPRDRRAVRLRHDRSGRLDRSRRGRARARRHPVDDLGDLRAHRQPRQRHDPALGRPTRWPSALP
ncbi:MAG: carboxylesterase family protein [Pseudomonadota bacterium]